MEIQNATRELRLLMSDLQTLSQSEGVNQIQEAVNRNILAGQVSAQAVVDHLAWRQIQILCGVFAVWAVVKLFGRRRKKASSAQ